MQMEMVESDVLSNLILEGGGTSVGDAVALAVVAGGIQATVAAEVLRRYRWRRKQTDRLAQPALVDGVELRRREQPGLQ